MSFKISSLMTDTSWQNFGEDLFSSLYAKTLTDRQTNAGHYITSSADLKCICTRNDSTTNRHRSKARALELSSRN